MGISIFFGTIVLSYLIGSIPIGLIIVKLATGQDVRLVHSGRTGGTNAMRAAGFWAGFGTANLDIFKGACGVYLARVFLPENHWLEILASVAAIIGHNYSIFLAERKDGKFRLRGGAGGATMIGGAMGLWFPNLLILVPIGAAILFGIGYASLTTMSMPLIAMIIFAVRAQMGLSPWIYVFYGALAEIILIIALLPNIKRLISGTERVVGWRAKRLNKEDVSDSKPLKTQSQI